MQSSDSIKDLASALAKAQAAMGGARKDKNNPAFRSKYADLSSVAEAIDAAIEPHGLSYVQVCHERENAAAVETIILHASGEWMSCGILPVPVTKHDAHGFGSALTYARRYSLSAAFGVVPEDDDGNAAAAAAPRAVPRKADSIPTAEQQSLTMDWCATIEAAGSMAELQETFTKAWKAVHGYGLPSLDNLIQAAKESRKKALAEKEAA